MKRPTHTCTATAPAGVISPRGRLLRATQVAKYLGLSYGQVLNIVALEQIAVLRSDEGRLIGIYERDCDDWVERRRVAAKEHVDHEPARVKQSTVDAAVRALVPED